MHPRLALSTIMTIDRKRNPDHAMASRSLASCLSVAAELNSKTSNYWTTRAGSGHHRFHVYFLQNAILMG